MSKRLGPGCWQISQEQLQEFNEGIDYQELCKDAYQSITRKEQALKSSFKIYKDPRTIKSKGRR